jgi:hypothetical protein
MLLPQSHAWTPRQKALILLAVLVGLVAFVGIVYGYERYYRGLREADLVGTWTRVDSGSGGGYYEFRRDGTMVMLDDDGQPTSIKASGMLGAPTFTCAFRPLNTAIGRSSCGTLLTFPEISFGFVFGKMTKTWRFGAG